MIRTRTKKTLTKAEQARQVKMLTVEKLEPEQTEQQPAKA